MHRQVYSRVKRVFNDFKSGQLGFQHERGPRSLHARHRVPPGGKGPAVIGRISELVKVKVLYPRRPDPRQQGNQRFKVLRHGGDFYRHRFNVPGREADRGKVIIPRA